VLLEIVARGDHIGLDVVAGAATAALGSCWFGTRTRGGFSNGRTMAHRALGRRPDDAVGDASPG
jgi:hypothetical protein